MILAKTFMGNFDDSRYFNAQFFLIFMLIEPKLKEKSTKKIKTQEANQRQYKFTDILQEPLLQRLFENNASNRNNLHQEKKSFEIVDPKKFCFLTEGNFLWSWTYVEIENKHPVMPTLLIEAFDNISIGNTVNFHIQSKSRGSVMIMSICWFNNKDISINCQSSKTMFNALLVFILAIHTYLPLIFQR